MITRDIFLTLLVAKCNVLDSNLPPTSFYGSRAFCLYPSALRRSLFRKLTMFCLVSKLTKVLDSKSHKVSKTSSFSAMSGISTMNGLARPILFVVIFSCEGDNLDSLLSKLRSLRNGFDKSSVRRNGVRLKGGSHSQGGQNSSRGSSRILGHGTTPPRQGTWQLVHSKFVF